MIDSDQPVHTIRLRRPWQKRLANNTSHRIDVPEPDPAETDFTAGSRLSPATYVRQFNRPSGLAETTQLRLRIGSWRGQLESLVVNEQELTVDGDTERFSSNPDDFSDVFRIDVDITHLLADHNCISITLAPAKGSIEIGSVEIASVNAVQLLGPVVLGIFEIDQC